MAVITLDRLKQNIWRNRSLQMKSQVFQVRSEDLEKVLDILGFSIDCSIVDIHTELKSYDKLKAEYLKERKGVSDKESYDLRIVETIEAEYNASIYETLDDHPTGELVPTLKAIGEWPAGSLAFQCRAQGLDPALSHFLSQFLPTKLDKASVKKILDEIARGVGNHILYNELKENLNIEGEKMMPNAVKPELSHVQIALIHVYLKKPITYNNMKSIAALYGFNAPNSGQALYQKYTGVMRHNDRVSCQESNRSSADRRLKDFEQVIAYLSRDNSHYEALQLAKDDLGQFQKNYNHYFEKTN